MATTDSLTLSLFAQFKYCSRFADAILEENAPPRRARFCPLSAKFFGWPSMASFNFDKPLSKKEPISREIVSLMRSLEAAVAGSSGGLF